MSEAPKWTPGPWAVLPRPDMRIEGSVFAIIDGERYPAAFVPAWDGPPNPAPDEARANAALIAAAPLLYDALVMAVDALGELGWGHSAGVAALAQARGVA